MLIKKATLLFFIIGISLSGFSQKHPHAKWHKHHYRKHNKIPRLDYWYNKEAKILYLISNDSNNVYIHLKAIDPVIQKMISRHGISTSIHIHGKNKRHFSVNFPVRKNNGLDLPNQQVRKEKGNERQAQHHKPELLNEIIEMELTGFDSIAEKQIVFAQNKNHVNGKLYFDQEGELVYTLIIPLKKLRLNLINTPPISINIALNSPNKNHGNGLKPSMGMNMGPVGINSGGRQGGRGGAGGMQGGGISKGNRPSVPNGMESPNIINIKIRKIKLLSYESI